MKRMLINATQPEEIRVALVDGQKLFDLDIEHIGREQKKANIYKGKITRVEPSLEAAFVDYGGNRHGFLPIKEISREYFIDKNFRGRPKIKDVVGEGQDVIVQIDKEERGNKGAALTTFISLAGCYLVLMPNNPRAGGISRRIEGEEREELKNAMRNVHVPKGMGCIVRTAGVGRSAEELEWDMSTLNNLWNAIKKAAQSRPAPFLIHQESDVIIRALRDYLRSDISEIIVDKSDTFEKVKRQIQLIRPSFINHVKLNEDREIPLFTRYQVESQIETAYQREVRLPSGGSIVIDPTEALISIDINSARATKGADIEETAFQTNKEAAEEIARQLRLRDMGGLIVIDFIDMSPIKNQREVENVLRAALARDRARVQIGKISKFGLLEMSRQRLKPSLGESAHHVCPRCTGTGAVRGIESLALSILRLVEEESTKDLTTVVQAELPVEVATFLLNEKRKIIHAIEKRQSVQIIIVPNPYMDRPNYEISRKRSGEAIESVSYKVPVQPELEVVTSSKDSVVLQAEQAAVTATTFETPPAPTHIKKEAPGLITRVWKKIKALIGEDKAQSQPQRPGNKNKRGGRYDRTRSRNYRRGRPTHSRGRNSSDSETPTNRRPKQHPKGKRPQQGQSRADDTQQAVDLAKESRTFQKKDRPPRQPREARQKEQAKNRANITAEIQVKPAHKKASHKKQSLPDKEIEHSHAAPAGPALYEPDTTSPRTEQPMDASRHNRSSDKRRADFAEHDQKQQEKPPHSPGRRQTAKATDNAKISEDNAKQDTVNSKAPKVSMLKSYAPATKPEPAAAIPPLTTPHFATPVFQPGTKVTTDVKDGKPANRSYSPMAKPDLQAK